MSSVEIYIVVEGQTEQTFVRDVLAPEMGSKGIYLHAALIGKPGQKGGDIRFERAQADIGNFLKQRPNIHISTMFDYYRLESDWPGNAKTPQRRTAEEKATRIEMATSAKIKELFPEHNVEKRFIPYIEMHEFEALLFSDAPILANNLNVKISNIEDILNECGEPEEIDDRPDSAPSKRLISIDNSYRKVAMGKTISEAIGIQTIRQKCPHFDSWISKIEQLVET
jgi:hypothetical protein